MGVGVDLPSRIVNYLIDYFVTIEPRFFGVGYRLYLVPVLAVIAVIFRDCFLGVFFDNIYFYVSSLTGFLLGIVVVGPSIGPLLVRINSGERVIVKRVENTFNIILVEKNYVSKSLVGVFIVLILILSTVIGIWLYYKPIYDIYFIDELSLVSKRLMIGYVTLTLDIIATGLFSLFWLVVGCSLAYIVHVYHWSLKTLSEALRREVSGENVLSIDKLLLDMISSKGKKALSFLIFKRRLSKIVDYIYPLMKKLLTVSIAIIAAAVVSNYFSKENMIYGVISAAIIGVGLLVPAIYILYSVMKWDSELRLVITVELKNLKIKAFEEDNERLAKSIIELENLSKELGRTLIRSRELWELIAAITTLMATIIASITSIKP